jgi:MoxR-like ATPase
MNQSPTQQLLDQISTVVVGKQNVIKLMVTALIAGGHVLLEDVPGLGKTLMAKALASSIGGSFKRIQFTPDLLPSDVTGFSMYDQKKQTFEFHPGPILCNILLADEINRTIPRTQSSLLESMGEFQITVDGKTLTMPSPFFVIATQNPIEMDGTFPLPEAQLDRFLMRIDLGYPTQAEEVAILQRFQGEDPLNQLKPVISPDQVTQLQHQRQAIHISDEIRSYISYIASATRSHPKVRFGISPRGSLGLLRASQALALIHERDYVIPDDIKQLAFPVLLHRLILKQEERIRGTQAATVLEEVIEQVAVPIPE